MTLQTDQQLVDEYFERGGTITFVPSGDAMHPFKATLAHQSLTMPSDVDE